MEKLSVANTYGEALFEAAAALDKIGEFSSQLALIREVFNDEPAFFELLKTPTVAGSERKNVIKAVFEGKVERELLNFLCVLIDKRRVGQFTGICAVFERFIDEKSGVTAGKIISAVALTDAQKERFEDETGKLLQKRVRLVNETDASLIGGVRIYIDGKLIDASIRTKLDRLKEQLY